MEKSCGTIPYTVKEGDIYYLIIKAKNHGYWGFPKGHVETGEAEIETALRETLEETSVKASIRQGFRHEINYVMGNGVNKTVVYFLASFQDQLPKRYKDYEEFEYLLISFNEAYQMLAFDSMKKMLKSANDFLVMDI